MDLETKIQTGMRETLQKHIPGNLADIQSSMDEGNNEIALEHALTLVCNLSAVIAAERIIK